MAKSLPIDGDSAWSGHSEKEQNEVVISKQICLLLPTDSFEKVQE